MTNTDGVPITISVSNASRPAEWYDETRFFHHINHPMNTLQIRKAFTKSNAQLKQLRHDYINENRQEILSSTGNEVIHQKAMEMFETGLYASPAILPKSDKAFQDMRFSIVRAIYRIDVEIWGKNVVGEWWFWLPRNGFDHRFGRNLKQYQSA